MPLGTKNSRSRVWLATLMILPCAIATAQTSSGSADQIASPITVSASANANQTGSAQFLTTFISTAARLTGPKFISCLSAAVKLRPDLAGKLVTCALNIARLHAHTLIGRLPLATINQIVSVAVAAAPEAAPEIVKAAIQSEPYASAQIVAAAVASAPDQAEAILATATPTTPMLIVSLTTSLNPTESAPSDTVNSPEQPPVGP
jgi:hypothetical protein